MRKCFLTGLVILLPVAVTAWVVVFLVRFLTNPFMGLVAPLLQKLPLYSFLDHGEGIRIISEIAILLLLFLLTLLLGILARRLLFHSMLKIGDSILYKIPLFNKVYKTSKEIVTALFSSKEGSFQQVVMIHFPYKNCYCLGLLSTQAPKSCSDPTKNTLMTVFLPTTPNPTRGFLTMVPEKDLIYLDMKTEQAIKYIVSCGVIQPERASRNP